MRTLIGSVALLTTLAGSQAAAGWAQTKTTTIFVVRHAEKGPETPDPSLTPAGRARARALAAALRDAGITTIFVSEFKRTQETASPLVQLAGITAERLSAGKVDSLVARLHALPLGSRALVVTHSNLVPIIVHKLGGGSTVELTDSDYDRLYVVTLNADGSADVLYLHYGEIAGGGSMKPPP